MKEKKRETKKRVFARLIAQEHELIRAGHEGTGTCVSTAAPPGGSKDVSNLEWDHDHPPPL